VWQASGVVQWWMISAHLSALAGRAPVASVACPENEMRSPTFHVSDELGVSITGVGGVPAGPKTCASQKEIPYGVARVTPSTRT
jgi:hypothetical protein